MRRPQTPREAAGLTQVRASGWADGAGAWRPSGRRARAVRRDHLRYDLPGPGPPDQRQANERRGRSRQAAASPRHRHKHRRCPPPGPPPRTAVLSRPMPAPRTRPGALFPLPARKENQRCHRAPPGNRSGLAERLVHRHDLLGDRSELLVGSGLPADLASSATVSCRVRVRPPSDRVHRYRGPCPG